jgi:hypothetical protein
MVVRVYWLFLCFLLGGVGFSTSALAAGYLIEPMVGFETGYQIQNSNSSSESGLNYGIRGVANVDSWLVGADLMWSSLSVNSSPAKDTLSGRDVGLIGGYAFSMFDLMATFWINSTLSSKLNGEYTGSGGYSLRGSFKITPLFALVIEKNLRSFNHLAGAGINTLTIDSTLLGVSLPYSF